MKNKIKKNIFWIILIISIAIIIILAYLLFKKNKEVQLVNTNLYNSNFYELVDYIQNVETYLSKSTISTSSTHSAETLTYLWREANLAQTYLSELSRCAKPPALPQSSSRRLIWMSPKWVSVVTRAITLARWWRRVFLEIMTVFGRRQEVSAFQCLWQSSFWL